MRDELSFLNAKGAKITKDAFIANIVKFGQDDYDDGIAKLYVTMSDGTYIAYEMQVMGLGKDGASHSRDVLYAIEEKICKNMSPPDRFRLYSLFMTPVDKSPYDMYLERLSNVATESLDGDISPAVRTAYSQVAQRRIGGEINPAYHDGCRYFYDCYKDYPTDNVEESKMVADAIYMIGEQGCLDAAKSIYNKLAINSEPDINVLMPSKYDDPINERLQGYATRLVKNGLSATFTKELDDEIMPNIASIMNEDNDNWPSCYDVYNICYGLYIAKRLEDVRRYLKFGKRIAERTGNIHNIKLFDDVLNNGQWRNMINPEEA